MKSLAAAVLAGSLLIALPPSAPAPPDPAGADASVAAGPASAAAPGAAAIPAADLTGVVQQYCTGCHNDRRLRGNMSLDSFQVPQAPQKAETAERMIKKLRAGMMPPPGARRPGGDTLTALAATLESEIDAEAAKHPDPGTRPFQRLNQADYKRVIQEMLGLEIDPSKWLPNDQNSAGFDNIADVQAMSPALMDAYLNAASEIARMAIGQKDAPVSSETYTNPPSYSQHEWERAKGAPYGTRGGISVLHDFPADGLYIFSMEFMSGWGERYHDIDISIDGKRVALLHYGGDIDFQGRKPFPVETDSIRIPAGQHRLTAAFVKKMDGPYEDLLRPNDWSLSGTEVSYGTTSLPQMESLTVEGPYRPSGVSETPSRQRIFTCRPTAPSEERPCAERIVQSLATKAYRRPLKDSEVDDLMAFYDQGAKDGGFEVGVRTALEAILSSPYFVFRIERQPSSVKPGQIYELSDLDLASRLSFFLWDGNPDQELLDVAKAGKLNDPKMLEQQTLRMLADPRSKALSTRFASLWLRLQDLDKVQPDAFWYPNFSEQLRDDMRQETQTFFYNLVKHDRSVLDILDADYSYLNERLAKHYGIPGVVGPEFRQVTYPENIDRRGVLGQGSILLETSLGNRTSPVLRGKWVMEVLLGTPPPPPPRAFPPWTRRPAPRMESR